jgi:DNA-binding LytR/AlgR family response regulator
MLTRSKTGLFFLFLAIVASAFLLFYFKNRHDAKRLIEVINNVDNADSLRISAAQELLLLKPYDKYAETRIEAFSVLGDLDSENKKERHYHDALSIASQYQRKEKQPAILNKMAILNRKNKNFQKAISLHEQALALTVLSADSASYLNSLGITHMGQRNHSAAKLAFEKANFLNLKNENLQQAASVYNNLGLIAQRDAQYGESRFYYGQALEIREELKDTIEWARVLKNLAITYNKVGDFASAAEKLSEAIALFEAVNLGNTIELGSAYNSLGVANANLKEYESAVVNYSTSIRIRREINNLSGLSGSYNNLAIVYRYQSLFDSAKYYFKLSIALKKEIDSQPELLPVYKNLAEVYIEQDSFNLAKSYLDSAATLNQVEQNDRMSTSLYLSNAILAIAQSDAKNAGLALDKAFVRLQKIKSTDLLLEYYDLKRKLSFLQNVTWQDPEFMVKYDSLNDEVFKKQRLAILKANTEKDNIELVWLAEQNEINKSKAQENERQSLAIFLILLALVIVAIIVYYYFRKKLGGETSLKVKAENTAQLLEQNQLNLEKGIQSGLAFFKNHLVIRSDVRDKDSATILEYKDINLVKASGDHLYWHTAVGKRLMVRATMNSIENELKPHGLLRCHRSWIVNKEFVVGIEAVSGSAYLFLKSPTKVLTTSKSKQRQLVEETVEKIAIGKKYLADFNDSSQS